MHSKLQGLAKPNRLSMPRPAGECSRAISGKPQAGCIAWKKGKRPTEQRSPGYTRGTEKEWPATHGRGQYNAPPTRGSQRKARENGKNSVKERNDIPESPRSRPARGSPRKKTQTPSAARGSAGQGASWTATAEKRRRRVASGRGPAPEVSCSPQPGVHDHHSRFREKLTTWNCVEVVVGSKLHYVIYAL